MRRCEYKKRYNPSTGKHEYHHIYGGGILDPARRIVAKVFSKSAKKIASDTAKKAATVASNKTGAYVGNKAGDKIIKLLQQGKTPPNTSKQTEGLELHHTPATQPHSSTLSQDEINQRVQRILNGGKIRKINF